MKQINRSFLLILILCLADKLAVNAQQSNYLKYVNPFIGTAKSNVVTNWGSDGGIYPGAVVPSGFVQISPETSVSGTKGYHYQDSVIYYFSCFGHMSGFPEGSAGNFFLMPVNDTGNFEAGKYSRKFLHRDESANPGFYKVVFDEDRTLVEATTTLRTGFFRFTFPKNTSPQIFIADTSLEKTASKTVLRFTDGQTVVNFTQKYTDKRSIKGGWLFTFNHDQSGSTIIGVKLSRSSVSIASAQNNIDQEIGNNTFEQIKSKAATAWLKRLSVIDIVDPDENNKTVFYTALYHSLLIPWVIDDADGRYKGADHQIHSKTGTYQYGAFSPWDTFRSLHPLLTFLYPDKQKDVMLSMLDIFKQSGHLPIESMTGNHAIPILVDAYLKGITDIDKNLAYKAMKKSIVDGPFLQPDMAVYNHNGYIPFTRSESVTRTAEYAYDDWCLAQFAQKIIHHNADYALLSKRGNNYRNLFNVDELLLLPRDKDIFKLNPGTSGYKEGDKWVYSYFVPHNPKDLINLMGGDEQFIKRLDSVLTNKIILFDNETVFHIPYLFNIAGKPALTQKWCRQIMRGRFGNSPGGLPGNDDLGSTSSWYVFSAMGIYPFCPGRPVYTIGSTMFKSIAIHLPNGKKFVINSNNSAPANNYIQSLAVNGKDWQQLIVPHQLLLKGGSLDFEMGNKPGKWPRNNNPVELSEIKQHAVFSTINFWVSEKTVQPDELFTIYFKLKNKGATGVKTSTLLVDGRKYTDKNSMVPAGAEILDSLVTRLFPIGKVMLSLNNLAPIAIEIKQSGKLQTAKITNIMITPMVKLGSQQQLKYTLQNVNGAKQTFIVPVTINNKKIYSDTVTLAAGQKAAIQHSFNCLINGFQDVVISGNKVRFKVYTDSPEALLLYLSTLKNAQKDIFEDQSGFANNGHIYTEEKKTTGDFSFDDTHFVEVGHAASLDLLDTTLSMMAWVKPAKTQKGLVDILTKGDNNVLQMTDSKTLTFFAGGWGRGDCTVNLPVNWNNNWHHIAGVCCGNVLILYIDGELKGTAITANTVNLSGSNKWVIGRNEEFPSERFFHGQIDKVQIFGSALSNRDIKVISLNKVQ